jgi:pimeloyl-ACP methyl ester carboxylesterase
MSMRLREGPKMTHLSCAAFRFVLVFLAASCTKPGLAQAQTQRTLLRADGQSTQIADYTPSRSATCPTTMVLSHGFGGSSAALPSLARRMAAQGWRVIVMNHTESGRDVMRAAFQSGSGLAGVDAAARDRSKHAARFLDLDAAYAEAVRACRPPMLMLGGHSMGSQTTMMEAGAVPLIGRMGSNRFDAYIALSPQGIGTTYGSGAWRSVGKPVLMITGTNDRVVGADYTQRLTAFDGLPAGRKRLAVIAGAGHLQIGGVGSGSVDAVVNTLVAEFAAQISSGSWRPSAVNGVQITEK